MSLERDNPASTTSTGFEHAVQRALETPPAVTIPPDFAARVAAQAGSSRSSLSIAWPGFGNMTAIVCGVLLTVAMFVFAPQTTAGFSDLRFDLELLLLMELGGIGLLITRIGFDD